MSESYEPLPGQRQPAPGLVPAPATEAAAAAKAPNAPVLAAMGTPGRGPAPLTEPEPEPGSEAGLRPESEPESELGSEPRPGPGPEAPVPSPGGTPAAPEPLGVELEATGNPEVDAAVGRLRDADGLPVEGHIEVYEDVHQGLREALAALDENRG